MCFETNASLREALRRVLKADPFRLVVALLPPLASASALKGAVVDPLRHAALSRSLRLLIPGGSEEYWLRVRLGTSKRRLSEAKGGILAYDGWLEPFIDSDEGLEDVLMDLKEGSANEDVLKALDWLEARLQTAEEKLRTRIAAGFIIANVARDLHIENGKRLSAREFLTLKGNRFFQRSKLVKGNSAEIVRQSDFVTIVVKLLDGKRISGFFDNDQHLRDVFELVQENCPDIHAFQLHVSYPYRTFVVEDLETTLSDLGMKNRVLLIMTQDVNDIAPTEGVLDMFFAMIAALYAWIFSFFSGHGQTTTTTTNIGNRDGVHTLRGTDDEERKRPNEYFGGDSTVFQD